MMYQIWGKNMEVSWPSGVSGLNNTFVNFIWIFVVKYFRFPVDRCLGYQIRGSKVFIKWETKIFYFKPAGKHMVFHRPSYKKYSVEFDRTTNRENELRNRAVEVTNRTNWCNKEFEVRNRAHELTLRTATSMPCMVLRWWVVSPLAISGLVGPETCPLDL